MHDHDAPHSMTRRRCDATTAPPDHAAASEVETTRDMPSVSNTQAQTPHAVRGDRLAPCSSHAPAPLHGFGLRAAHYPQLLAHGPQVALVEAIAENLLSEGPSSASLTFRGGAARALLQRARREAELALHGVSLCLGSVDPLRDDYLQALVALQGELEPKLISDHLCFGSFGGHYGHDLWPLPYTEEAIAHVVERIQRVQDRLGRRLLVENVSSYVEYRASVMPEWEFLSEVVERADAAILLDVNNVIVSAKNHNFCPEQYVDALPLERVSQLHLAGHTDYGTHAIDDHGSAVPSEVWALYERVVMRFGAVPTIVEWDEAVPDLYELRQQSALARERERAVLARAADADAAQSRAWSAHAPG